jgi:hypothetical protein
LYLNENLQTPRSNDSLLVHMSPNDKLHVVIASCGIESDNLLPSKCILEFSDHSGFRRMVSSGMLHRVDLVRTDGSEELSASFIRVTRIGELGTTLAVTSNRRTLEALSSSETSFITRATRRNISEDTILHSRRRENLKSYKVVTVQKLLQATGVRA